MHCASCQHESRADALQALERGDCERAIKLLETAMASSPMTDNQPWTPRPPGDNPQALLALAYFKSEKYDQATQRYEEALKLEPDRDDLREMLAIARANAAAAVHVHVPDVQFFDRGALLAAPSASALPAPLPARPRGLAARIGIALGNVLGAAATVTVNALTHAWGRTIGYRGAVWTNWYRWRSPLLGVLTLAYVRELLNARNLVSTYPSGALTGFQGKRETPPQGVTHFRTADGTWNDLNDPMQGAAGTRFLRNVALDSVRPETGKRLLTPNPREVSLAFLTRNQPMQEVPFLNLLAAAWIQFMNHDWVSHGEVHLDDVIEVPLPPNDPARARYRQTEMLIARTQADPTRASAEPAPISFINEVTHWWDGSQIYGSDQATQDRLRSHVDGKLRLNPDGTLPVAADGVEDTGFRRNWWVGLALLHTLFAREHNAICDHLKAAYPDWDDNRLFNVARLVNAAVMAKIHSVEWTPAILPNPALDKGMNGNWYGLLTNLLRKGKARKTRAPVNVRNPELGGLVGNPIDKHGVAFGFSEEFVEVYRLHSLLPETLALRRWNGEDGGTDVALPATRQAGSHAITRRFSLADLFFSFGTQHPGALVLNNYPRFMQELSIPGNPFLDLGALDILRARERGVPRYNEFRRQLQLNPIRRFEDLTDNPEHLDKLKQVYGSGPDAVEDLDLMIGTLAEAQERRPTGFGFGETLFQIFIVNASRRLQADRFYTDCYNEDVYTSEGLRWVDDTDLKTAILRQFPELAATGLANIKNAFEPWDSGEKLERERHPLREWDPELKADPWRGDAYPRGKD